MDREKVVTQRFSPLAPGLLQKNRLLGEMSLEARQRLLSYSELVQLRAGHVIDPARTMPSRAYFPVNALAMLLQQTPAGDSTQVAMVGSDGMIGLGLITGTDVPGQRCLVHTAGAVLAVDGLQLAREFARAGSAMRVLLRYMQELMAHMSQSAVCNRHHSIEQQLARWLLMAADRIGTREIETTHERIAGLLGVRREGISEASGRLREAGLIACRRGRFAVLDTPGLVQRACACYPLLRTGREGDPALQPTGTAPGLSTTEKNSRPPTASLRNLLAW